MLNVVENRQILSEWLLIKYSLFPLRPIRVFFDRIWASLGPDQTLGGNIGSSFSAIVRLLTDIYLISIKYYQKVTIWHSGLCFYKILFAVACQHIIRVVNSFSDSVDDVLESPEHGENRWLDEKGEC